MQSLFEPLTFLRGPALKNRFALAPLTNLQSHVDGKLSDDEYKWLTMRAEGGFSMTMTCAAHVQAIGQGFPGQLGIFSDDHLEGLTRLAAGINKNDSLSIVQLHHAGHRSPEELVGSKPVAPSAHEESGARALSTAEVEQLIEDFIAAAERAEKAGFDGVEIHGAHGYILCQFLSSDTNLRDDQYGGALENRARPLFDIIAGIRQRCGKDFNVGVRLTPERFGIVLDEAIAVAQRLFDEAQIDYLDMSLWDAFKEPTEEAHKGRTLMDCFTALERGEVRLGIAGKIRTPEEAKKCMASGIDFILLGRAAIIHHNFPSLLAKDSGFTPLSNPVSAEHLRTEGLSDTFLEYMASWKGFVAETNGVITPEMILA
ncbi:NADH:flavin oxidoreductase [Gammaproteobacteria bacterium 53_120_T64]|nr:NADH:flavin oxidoreductase [Gammaproteobacteria bacterium 53_120_T64]